MNRPIKFRAWDDFNNEMYYPDGNGYFFDSFSHEDFVIDGNGRAIYLCDMSTPVNVELMQYTGLKDKNGKEIYEGDIIQVVGNVLQFRRGVEYLPKYAQFGYIDNTGEWVSLKKMNEYNPHSENTPRVIGNIYENPELLKEKEEQK